MDQAAAAAEKEPHSVILLNTHKDKTHNISDSQTTTSVCCVPENSSQKQSRMEVKLESFIEGKSKSRERLTERVDNNEKIETKTERERERERVC